MVDMHIGEMARAAGVNIQTIRFNLQFSLLPSRKAARLHPIEALRHE